ncbi:DUF4239 domain-containing protein [Streptomyces natalensis]|uniref:DUF4239 domain-containing protein n=1 Tax=Streptomyces natalensis ATCC 27448 TaxID=1240678 RepID=A0A0D7CSQ4_9ACTN|nr:DUF4239 domain-containing protein [Streptomyces natalensis]KIZ19274.1 hypothetical protein SNA_01705 [Streptomyces natalensis ATCC 27448]
MITVIVVAVLALLAALAANRFLRPRLVPEGDEGMNVRDLVGPLLTLTVLLLAFTLVTASSSYKSAQEAVRTEASAVDNLAEVAEYAPTAQRDRLQADVICYARAVRVHEWPAMANGNSSAVASTWSTDFRQAFKNLSDHSSFGMLVSADNQRAKARQDRLAESTPAVPSLIFWFLLVTMTVTVIALGMCLPRKNNKAQLSALVLVTALLTTTLIITRDAEQPFGGAIDVKPTALADVEGQASRPFLAGRAAHLLPCDEQGRKTLPS